jgi:hypothetical protein
VQDAGARYLFSILYIASCFLLLASCLLLLASYLTTKLRHQVLTSLADGHYSRRLRAETACALNSLLKAGRRLASRRAGGEDGVFWNRTTAFPSKAVRLLAAVNGRRRAGGDVAQDDVAFGDGARVEGLPVTRKPSRRRLRHVDRADVGVRV